MSKRDEADELLDELRAWAEQAKHGEQKELAKELGVKQAKLNHWITGRRLPTLRDGLRLQTFLKSKRSRKAK